MPSWRFGGQALKVAVAQQPSWSNGARWIAFEAPGNDGVTAAIPDGLLPVSVAVTVYAMSPEELTTLTALFAAVSDDVLEVPVGTDAWVYDAAHVRGPVQWQGVLGGRAWQARVEFVCWHPRPTWKSSGLAVY